MCRLPTIDVPHQKACLGQPIILWRHVIVSRSPQWALSPCCPFCGFGQVWNDRCPPCSVMPSSVTALESLEFACSRCLSSTPGDQDLSLVPVVLSLLGCHVVRIPWHRDFSAWLLCLSNMHLFLWGFFLFTTQQFVFKAMTHILLSGSNVSRFHRGSAFPRLWLCHPSL